jgi:uncharacterized protein (TIGR03435 family)
MKWIIFFVGLLILPVHAASPAFEVASIKPHRLPPNIGVWSVGPPPIRINGNRVTMTEATFRGLVMAAFDVKDYQFSAVTTRGLGGGDLYDIVANTEGDDTPTLDLVRQMLQTLLADRFQLKLHRETKELPVYDLVVGKNGPKLKHSAKDTEHGMHLAPLGFTLNFQFSNSSMPDLLRALTAGMNPDRPLFDKTGLMGSYDFTLEFTRTNRLGELADPAGTSVFTAVQEQLGLKLETAKEPTEFLVIEHAESPSEN